MGEWKGGFTFSLLYYDITIINTRDYNTIILITIMVDAVCTCLLALSVYLFVFMSMPIEV